MSLSSPVSVFVSLTTDGSALEDTVRKMNRSLDESGLILPSFESLSVHQSPKPVDLKKVTAQDTMHQSSNTHQVVLKPGAARPYEVWWPFVCDDNDRVTSNPASPTVRLRHTHICAVTLIVLAGCYLHDG